MRRGIVIILAMAVLLAGCSLAPRKTELVKSGSIRVLILGGAGYDTNLIGAFKTAHPGIEVEAVAYPGGDFLEVITDLKAGTSGIDAVIAPGHSLLFREGGVLPLDGAVRDLGINLTPYGKTIELGKYKEKIYGLPVSVSPMVVLFNREMFAAAGLPEPEVGWGWDQFEAALYALAQSDNPHMESAAVISPWTFLDLLLTADGGPLSEDLATMTAHLERIHRYLGIEGGLLPFQQTGTDNDHFQAFSKAAYGMLITYWEFSFGHSKPSFSYGLAPLPGLTAEDPAPGIGTLAMVAAGSKNRDAALTFVQFVSGPTAARVVATLPGAPVPAYSDAGIQQQWLSHARLGPQSAFLLQQKYVPLLEYPDDVVPLLFGAVDATLKGEKSAREAMAEFDRARAPFMKKR